MDNHSFLSETEKLDKSVSFLVYCRSGSRSGQVCQVMDFMGFKETNNLIGGVLDWKGDLSI